MVSIVRVVGGNIALGGLITIYKDILLCIPDIIFREVATVRVSM